MNRPIGPQALAPILKHVQTCGQTREVLTECSRDQSYRKSARLRHLLQNKSRCYNQSYEQHSNQVKGVGGTDKTLYATKHAFQLVACAQVP